MKFLRTLILNFIAAMVILVFLVWAYFIFHASGIGKELLMTVRIPNKGYEIKAYLVNWGATTPYYIQLVKVYDFLNYPVHICFLEGYTDVKGIKPISSTEIEVLAGGKGKFSKSPDTLRIKIE